MERANDQMQKTDRISQSIQELEHIIKSNTQLVESVQSEIETSSSSYLDLEQQIEEIKKTNSLISALATEISAKTPQGPS